MFCRAATYCCCAPIPVSTMWLKNSNGFGGSGVASRDPLDEDLRGDSASRGSDAASPPSMPDIMAVQGAKGLGAASLAGGSTSGAFGSLGDAPPHMLPSMFAQTANGSGAVPLPPPAVLRWLCG